MEFFIFVYQKFVLTVASNSLVCIPPVDFTKNVLNLIFGGIFDIWPNPVYCQRGRWTFKSKAASTRFFPTDSLRIFSVLLTVWKNVWFDSGFPAFFPKGLGFHFLAIQHCNWNQSSEFMQFWISTNIKFIFIRWFHEFSFNHETKNFFKNLSYLGTYFYVL